jgi:hypothetical protein
MSDFFFGLAHGAGALFGMGSLVDPVGDARSGLSKATKDMNQMTATDSLSSADSSNKNITNLIQVMNLQKKDMDEMREVAEDLIWSDISEQTLFMKILSVIVFIVIVFFLMQKKCC